MFKRYFAACGIVHGNQNDQCFIQVLKPKPVSLRLASFTPLQHWCHLPNLRSPNSSRLTESWCWCWCWARLTAARKVSNQLVDDSRHKLVMCKWVRGILWCWHVHNFEICFVNNVCIHHDCIQKVNKHSYPPPP